MLVVGPDEEGLRLDIFCASHIEELSRNQIQKHNSEGRILVDGVAHPDRYPVKAGEAIRISLPPVDESQKQPIPQDIPLHLVYEDDDLIVINKEAGMVVHPAHGNWEGTVINALLGCGVQLSQIGRPERPGVVHRLDKDTSGLLVVAKNDAAYKSLTEQLKSRQVQKIYHALSWGHLGVRHRTIDDPIGRHPVHRQKMAVAKRGGREARTEVFVVDTLEHFDYIRVTTFTGRTHQIRVHLAHVSHPILGDPVYGGRRIKGVSSNARIRSKLNALLKVMQRQALHASKISLSHPSTGDRLEFTTALPEDMRLALEMLYRETSSKEVRG
ncbi:MAG: RluA family pseudouridine synthase [Candidatus Latescibacterota bacterium]|nr:MAG: RluA family pseudouridine synthase [Candidatus Latescibacterota bacterium]